MEKIIIKRFAGIGDYLFITPSFRVIKEAYPNCFLEVNTNRASLAKHNPFIDRIGIKDEGVCSRYPAPDGTVIPSQHHIITDWEVICKAYGLKTKRPNLRPELYLKNLPAKRDIIGVQIQHKRQYHSKRVWPYFEELAKRKGFEPIPKIIAGDIMQRLVYQIASYKAVVCPEGGISHIAAALDIPAIVLMGGFTKPEWTGYDNHINLVNKIDCSPCFDLNPCKHDFKCWDKFSIGLIETLANSLGTGRL